MDCVTCILVGMCVMCGPGFGAQSPGRRMTEAELTQALESYIRRFQPSRKPVVTTSSKPYSRRQSFIPDIRLTEFGIGKRDHMSSYSNGYEQGFGRLFNRVQPFRTQFFPGLGYSVDNVIKGGAGTFGPTTKQVTSAPASRTAGSVLLSPQRKTNRVTGRLNNVIRYSGLTIQSLMKSLKRSKLEHLLRKTISESNKLAAKIQDMNKENNAVAMETDSVHQCH